MSYYDAVEQFAIWKINTIPCLFNPSLAATKASRAAQTQSTTNNE